MKIQHYLLHSRVDSKTYDGILPKYQHVIHHMLSFMLVWLAVGTCACTDDRDVVDAGPRPVTEAAAVRHQ